MKSSRLKYAAQIGVLIGQITPQAGYFHALSSNRTV